MTYVRQMAAMAAVCFALIGNGSAQRQATQSAGTNPDPELVSQLTNQLHITPEQATGGAGAVFGLVKSKLSPQDFSKIASAIPGIDGFLKTAPAAESTAVQGSSQASSAIGAVGSTMPGGAGGLTSLAGSFQALGLSPSMVGQFTPILQNYIGSKGGAGTASLFAGALK